MKLLQAGGSRSEFYSQDLFISRLPLRSAQESSLFFSLIISYCQLKLVLAAYGLLIVNSVGPHLGFLYSTGTEATVESFVICNHYQCQYTKEKLTFLHNTTQQQLPLVGCFIILICGCYQSQHTHRHQPPPLPLFFDRVSLSVSRPCLVPPRD